MIVLLILVGAAVEAGAERRVPSARMRRRIGIVAVAMACVVPLAAFTSVAFSERGIGDRIDELTSETKVAPQEGGGRVFAASSSRGKYWREAVSRVRRPALGGVGAGAFEKARLRYRTDASVTQHAHGWIPQTMADLGLLGLVVTTLLFLAWSIAALSATGLLPRRLLRREGDATPPPRRDWDTDRIAIVTLALVPLVFGIQSLLDWTWFIQEPAVMALIPAGFLAGLGPLGEGADRAARDEDRIQWRPDARRIVAAVAAVITALLLAWAIWQPEASDRATNDALALLDEKKFDQALAKTQDAEDLNPLTPDPLLVRAAIDTAANREDDAQTSLERAVILFPGDPQTWYRLAAFQLGTLDAPEQAMETVRGALYLDPHSKAASQLFLDSRGAATREVRRGRPRAQRVARASSVPGGARSDSTSKPSASQQPPQRAAGEEAQVRRERVDGSPAAQRRVCAGVVSARPPPGRSTRRTSDSSSCTSRTCSIVSAHSTRSNAPSSNGSGASGSSSTMRAPGQPAPCALERRSATRRPRSARPRRSSALRRPSPQPRSSDALGVAAASARTPEASRAAARFLRNELPELVVEAARAQLYQAPRARTTAGIVFSRIVRSRNTDQRSR